ncbi:MAG: glucosyltransferase domain-containing protein [Bacilli bacterium]|nr:glucosyltransferase domain-containing protein [Bacilli bacterium]
MIKKISNKKNISVIITTLLVGFIVHVPLISKTIITSDVLINSHYYNSYVGELAMGRFGLWIMGVFKSFLVFPEISLLFSLILIAILNIMIIDFFDIKSKFYKILLSMLIVINPITSAILLSSHYSIAIILSMLLAFYAFYNICRNKSKYRYIGSGLLLFIVYTLYQPSISIFLSLIVLYAIKQILNKKIKYRELLFNFLTFVIPSLIYVGIVTLLSLVIKTDPVVLLHTSNLLDLGKNFIRCYVNFFNYFIGNSIVKNTYLYTYVINIILFIIMILGIIKSSIKAKLSVKNLIIMIILILAIPLVFNASLLYSSEINFTLLLSMSYLLFIPFIISLDNYNYSFIFIVLCMLLLFRNYIIQDRATYYTLENTYNKTYAMLSDLYTKNTKHRPIMITGKLASNKTISNITRLNYGFVANEELIKDNYQDRSTGITKFYNYYLGIDAKYVSEKKYNKILKSNEYKKMKKYKVIEDTFVVKLK